MNTTNRPAQTLPSAEDWKEAVAEVLLEHADDIEIEAPELNRLIGERVAELAAARAQQSAQTSDLPLGQSDEARDAKRYRRLKELVEEEEYNGWDVLVPPTLPREIEGDLDAAIDAELKGESHGK